VEKLKLQSEVCITMTSCCGPFLLSLESVLFPHGLRRWALVTLCLTLNENPCFQPLFKDLCIFCQSNRKKVPEILFQFCKPKVTTKQGFH
jgi:hypothetical protein